MRSLPRMSLTSSVIGASLLAQQRIYQCLAACCRTCVEHVPDRLFVEPDQGDHDLLVTGEPADDPDGDVRIEWVGDPPELMAAGLPDSLEGRGFFGRLGREIVEFLQERGRDHEELCSQAESPVLSPTGEFAVGQGPRIPAQEPTSSGEDAPWRDGGEGER